MATTPAVYTAVQLAVPFWIRPHLATPDRTTVPIASGTHLGIQEEGKEIVVPLDAPGAWLTSEQRLDAAGQPASVPSSFADCLSPESGMPPREKVDGCVADLGYQQQATHQPAGNFWILQWAEMAIYLGVALGLAGFCAWWFRRRLN